MTLPDDMQALVLRHGGLAGAGAGADARVDAGPGAAAPAELPELLELRRLPRPRPAAGQLLIEVALSPVNPSDLLYVAGHYGQPRQRGAAAGFEGTGVVVAAGDPETAALVGGRVSFLATASGAWAEFALTDAASCVPVAEALRDEDAATLFVNPSSALAMIELAAQAGAQALVLTAAASQLGRMLIALARERGMAAIAVVRRPEAAAPLQALGAAEVLASGAPDYAARLDAALKAHKPRILLDAVGDRVAAGIFAAMPAHSRWVAYGLLSEDGARLPDMREFVFAGKRIEGFWLSRWLRAASPAARASAVHAAQQHFLEGRWHTQVAARIALAEALPSLGAALALPGKVLLVP